MTEKVRIKSLIEETRITAVNTASGSGYTESVQDISETETEDEDEEDPDEPEEGDYDQEDSMSISLRLSKVYKRTLEILGDSLVTQPLPPAQDNDTPMT